MPTEITRRDLLKTAAITGAALPALWAGALPAADGAPRIRKGVKMSMISGDSVLERFQAAKQAGFEGIDIDQRFKHSDVLEAIQKTGVIVHGVVDYDHWRDTLSSPDPAVRAKGVATLEESLRDAKAYGGTTVLLVPAVVNKDVSYQDAYTRSQAEVRKVLPLAKELGIKILFENVWNSFLLSPVEAVRYIDEFESDMVGSYFDVGNIVRYGWPEHWIRALGKRIGKIDVKEYSRQIENTQGPRAGFGVEINEGDCDWPAVVAALKEIGFSGWATAEVPGGNVARLTEISKRMDEAFKTF
jgi:L-ribulose-5-phosphate 3-epimerase